VARSSRVFAHQRSQRRATAWVVGTKTGAAGEAQSISGTGSTLGGLGALSLADGLTVIRTRGELLLFLGTAGSAFDGFHGAFGVGIATERAFNAGIASLPLPLTDEDDEMWLYHRYFQCFAGGTIAAATAAQQADQVNPTAAAVRIEVDSKAMRKFESGMVIFAALQVVETGVATLEWSFASRMLVKLP